MGVKTTATDLTTSTFDEKRALRTLAQMRRDSLNICEREAMSAEITARLVALPSYREARTVLAYMSMGAEFGSDNFVEQVLRDGKRLVLPRVDKLSRALVLHHVTDLRDLTVGVWGIREPHSDVSKCDPSEIDFILVPGLAFDRTGNRLGYGGGFYDQLFARMDPMETLQTPFCMRVSAAFSMQIVDAVPITECDHRVNLIVTENELIKTEIVDEMIKI